MKAARHVDPGGGSPGVGPTNRAAPARPRGTWTGWNRGHPRPAAPCRPAAATPAAAGRRPRTPKPVGVVDHQGRRRVSRHAWASFRGVGARSAVDRERTEFRQRPAARGLVRPGRVASAHGGRGPAWVDHRGLRPWPGGKPSIRGRVDVLVRPRSPRFWPDNAVIAARFRGVARRRRPGAACAPQKTTPAPSFQLGVAGPSKPVDQAVTRFEPAPQRSAAAAAGTPVTRFVPGPGRDSRLPARVPESVDVGRGGGVAGA